jgi:hypothetical protein
MIEVGQSPFKVKAKMTKIENMSSFKLTYKNFFYNEEHE